MGVPIEPNQTPRWPSPPVVADYSMDMNDRVRQCIDDSREWFPEKTLDLVHQVIGLGNEVGELFGWWKKWDRTHNRQLELLDPQTKANMADELIDILVYAFNVAACLGIDLEEEYERKRRFNQQRFGQLKRDADPAAEGGQRGAQSYPGSPYARRRRGVR